jgi:hypothetical protein
METRLIGTYNAEEYEINQYESDHYRINDKNTYI